jgi:hypothetical protein
VAHKGLHSNTSCKHHGMVSCIQESKRKQNYNIVIMIYRASLTILSREPPWVLPSRAVRACRIPSVLRRLLAAGSAPMPVMSIHCGVRLRRRKLRVFRQRARKECWVEVLRGIIPAIARRAGGDRGPGRLAPDVRALILVRRRDVWRDVAALRLCRALGACTRRVGLLPCGGVAKLAPCHGRRRERFVEVDDPAATRRVRSCDAARARARHARAVGGPRALAFAGCGAHAALWAHTLSRSALVRGCVGTVHILQGLECTPSEYEGGLHLTGAYWGDDRDAGERTDGRVHPRPLRIIRRGIYPGDYNRCRVPTRLE